MKKIFSRAALLISGVVLVISVAYTPDYFEISKQLDIFTNVFKEVNLYYVDETEPGELMDEAINSMLESLDPYTNYIPEERVEDYKIQTTGNYGGIGASIRKRDDYVVITAPYEGFAADKAGLKAGDLILKVDGKDVKGKSTDDVSHVLKGSPGTKVKVVIGRDGEEISKEIEREEVHVKSVPYYGMLDNGIGYIALTNFTSKASKEIKKALKDLKKEDLKGLILDLRGNPGGLLSEAVNVTNIFVDKGKEVVKTKGKLEEWEKTYKTLNSPEDTEIPLAVLISRGSASASEIVAGTLQDYDRAVIIGQRSFGKGLVQQTRKLSFGSQLKVTIAKYYTPSGRCIQAINYAERAEDGSVSKIPDSLRTEFTTNGGRAVYDGGGIDPDLHTEEHEVGGIIYSLYRKMILFDWATQYVKEHETIAEPASFRLTDEEFTAFIEWSKTQNIEYKTETERAINQLEETLTEEEHLELLKAELTALKDKYELEKKDELITYKADIKSLLEEEIVSRYYYYDGRLENALKHDDEVEKATEVLINQTKYNDILTAAAD